MTVVAPTAMAFLRAPRCVSLLLYAFMLMQPGLAQAQTTESCAKVPAQTSKALYSLACSGKSECGAADTLSVTPASAATPTIAAMCLDFGEGWLVWLPAGSSVKTPQAPLSYPLAPLIARALAEGRPANARARLAAAPGGRLPIDVVLVDTEGGNFREHLLFDTVSLWSSGQLSFGALTFDCKPCRFDGTLTLSVPALATWRRATNADLTKLQLVLNGTRMPGLPILPDQADGRGTVSFKLHRVSDQAASVAAWDSVLKPALSWDPSAMKVALADDRAELAQAKGEVAFETMPISRRIRWGLGALALLCLIAVGAGLKSRWGFLKDNFGIPAAVFPTGQRGAAFSMGKTQMALWTVVVVVGAVLVAVALDAFPAFNDTVVILLGISVGTAVGAAAVVPDAITKAIADYQADPKDKAPALLALAQSEGFWRDISRDYGSTSPDLHRLQNIAFTIVLMVVFVSSALLHGVFPDFSSSWLTLMGVSGGAYVGFKAAAAK